jgi:hypothetical protein
MQDATAQVYAGRGMSDSYVTHKGPGKFPEQEKWLQHMETTGEDFLVLIQGFVETDLPNEDVAGWSDQPNSQLATACYCKQSFSVVMFLAYQYHDNPKRALSQNVMLRIPPKFPSPKICVPTRTSTMECRH